MNDEPDPMPQPPRGGGPPRWLWLFCAFAPALVTISIIDSIGPGLMPVLFGLNVCCSSAAGMGLVRGIQHNVAQLFLGLFLVAIFFVLNIVIVIYVGCSHSAI